MSINLHHVRTYVFWHTESNLNGRKYLHIAAAKRLKLKYGTNICPESA